MIRRFFLSMGQDKPARFGPAWQRGCKGLDDGLSVLICGGMAAVNGRKMPVMISKPLSKTCERCWRKWVHGLLLWLRPLAAGLPVQLWSARLLYWHPVWFWSIYQSTLIQIYWAGLASACAKHQILGRIRRSGMRGY